MFNNKLIVLIQKLLKFQFIIIIIGYSCKIRDKPAGNVYLYNDVMKQVMFLMFLIGGPRNK